MKKYLLFLLFVLLTSFASAQTISYRKDDAQNLSVGTNYLIHKKQVGFSLNYMKSKETNKEAWLLGVVFVLRDNDFTFDEGSKILIRTFSDKIVELIQIKESHKVEGEVLYPYKSLNDYDTKDYRRYPDYFISSDDLNTIMKEGIKKMRFETTRGMKDLNYEKDELGTIIADEYNLIIGKSSFEEGF